jgi:nucleoside 2-deoxyribosyltransferase
VYIAASLGNVAQYKELQKALSAVNIGVTYDWTVHGAVWESKERREQRLMLTAQKERDGIRTADVFIALLGAGRQRGTHVELGMALTYDIPTILYGDLFGPDEQWCVFYIFADTQFSASTPIGVVVREVQKLANVSI